MESPFIPSFCPLPISLLFSITVKFSLVSHLTCLRLHYLPLCSVWNNGPSISLALSCNYAFVFTLLLLSLPIYSLHCLYAPHIVATLPSLVNSLFSFSLSISILTLFSSFKSGWAKFGNGPSDQASPVENHFGRGERKMCCCTHLSQVRNAQTSTNTHTYTQAQTYITIHACNLLYLVMGLFM